VNSVPLEHVRLTGPPARIRGFDRRAGCPVRLAGLPLAGSQNQSNWRYQIHPNRTQQKVQTILEQIDLRGLPNRQTSCTRFVGKRDGYISYTLQSKIYSELESSRIANHPSST
jgi:hypothetical protein